MEKQTIKLPRYRDCYINRVVIFDDNGTKCTLGDKIRLHIEPHNYDIIGYLTFDFVSLSLVLGEVHPKDPNQHYRFHSLQRYSDDNDGLVTTQIQKSFYKLDKEVTDNV